MVAKHSDKSIFYFFWSGIIKECQRMFGKYFGPTLLIKKCEHEGNNLTIFKTITFQLFFVLCVLVRFLPGCYNLICCRNAYIVTPVVVIQAIKKYFSTE